MTAPPAPESNFRLLGTIVGSKEDLSKAIIENTATGERRFYRKGDNVESYRLLEIHPADVVLVSSGGVKLTLRLSSSARLETPASPIVFTSRPDAKNVGDKFIERWKNKTRLTAEAVTGEIKNYLDELSPFLNADRDSTAEKKEELTFPNTAMVAENTWQVGEDDALRAGRNAGRILSQVNISPYSPAPDAEVQGFQLKIVAPDSVWEKMGFRNGDVITQVNDTRIRNLAHLIIAARQVQVQGAAQVNVIRNNQPVKLTYVIKK